MGLDIYKLTVSREYITTIDSTDSIESGLIELENKSGISIDNYGTTRLYSNHLEILTRFTSKKSKWKRVFDDAITNKYNLLIEGD